MISAMPTVIKTIIPSQCQLGEGPLYCDEGSCVMWVDIKKPSLHSYHLDTQQWHTIALAEQICWLLPSARYGFIAGFRNALYQLEPSTGKRTLLKQLEIADHVRLNDAIIGPQGAPLFGTMDDNEQLPCGQLLQLNDDLTLSVLDTGYTVSNGPALSTDHRMLFSTDSAARTIYCFDVDACGALSNKRLFTRFTQSMGYPDGMCVDSDDNLWVAAFQGGGVYCFGKDGRQREFISLPAWQITSVAFVGTHRDTLVVTSARVGLDEASHKQFPHNGDTFLLDVGRTGPRLPVGR